MAKLQNLRPLASKRTIRLAYAHEGMGGGTNKVRIGDLLLAIANDIKDGSTTLTGIHFFFRIKSVSFDVTSTTGQTIVKAFGRQYETVNRSNNAGYDATVKPEANEFGGLGHDSNVMNELSFDGSSTTAIPVVDTEDTNTNVYVVIEYVPKSE